jgi:hypothetical protein
MEAVKGSAAAGGRRLRRVAWPIGIVGAALILLGAGPARAGGDHFENGFKDEAGRIAAHAAYGVGAAVLAGLVYGPPGAYYRPYGPPPGYYGYGYGYPPVVEHHHYHHRRHHHGHGHYGGPCEVRYGGPHGGGYERYERWERGYEHAGYDDD